ncbi:MAG: alpha/beta hydrolase fold [Candidatus Solibacter sp.]|jgi:pimeloyl-ACP methyl ester carboxylesterase|nr:alpha/beta hydrolase fold [Candidatus Solibacter sp.]
MKKWWFVVAAVVALAMVAVPRLIRYRRADLEKFDLTTDVREKAPGSFIRLPNGVMHCELAGPASGQFVVLVNGFSSPYAEWDPTFAGLVAAGFRVLRYDHFGRGLSDRPEARHDPEFFDKQLQDLLDALKVEAKVDLVGQDMGGAIAAAFVNRHPMHARKLVMIDPGYRTGYQIPWRLRLPFSRGYGLMIMASKLPERQMDDFVHPERFSSYQNAYREQMRYRGFRKAILSTMFHTWVEDATAEYRQLGKTGRPVMLLWGIADEVSRIDLSAKLLEDIPRVEFHVIKDAGHMPQLEHPEVVNPLIVDFLRK